MLVNISDLKAEQLKYFLREQNLPTTGNKSELILRLTEAIGSEVIEMESTETNMQSQINELKNMMQQLMSTVIQNTNSERNAQSLQLPPVVANEIRNENRRQYSIKEIAETIPEFDPTDDGSLSAEQFVGRVDTAMSAYGFEEKALILAVYSKVKGSAKLWLNSSDQIYSNWKELAERLVEEFGTNLDEAEIHKKIASSYREPGENIIDYCFRISALGRKYNLSDQAIIKYTRDGLKNRDLQSATAAMRFSSLREMREIFSEFLRNTPSSKYSFSSNSFKNETENVKIKTEKIDVTEKKDFKCFNCAQEGHYSFNCPQPQRRPRCINCQKVHRQGDPQNCGKQNSSVRSVETCDHLFTRKITLNGVQLSAFIDTGSQCNMVRRTVAESLPCKLEPCALTIKGICGDVRTLKSRFSAECETDNAKFCTVFYVTDDDLLEEDVLIGQQIFADKKIKCMVENGQFVFQRGEGIKMDQDKVDVQCGDVADSVKIVLFTLVKEFHDVFALNLGQIGQTNTIELKIELDNDKPIAQAPYRIPEPKKRIVNEMVQDLLQNDIITPSESEYASPIILVKKKDGGERFCVDYRMLNRHMKKQIYPMPNIEERLQEATKYKLFSTLDLNSGYYQIPVEPQSRKFTAFVTTEGIYEFKRMPFGLKNAPIAFQRLMAKLKDKTRPGDMLHYMDDILVGAESETEMMNKLRRIFNVLREFKLTLNPRKCNFFQRHITFLGHQLTEDGVRPGNAKTEAIVNFIRPENLMEVRRFLGLSGYFRKFIPGYAVISEPLRQLLRKDEHFHWGESQQRAFLELKNALVSEPVLAPFKVEGEHQLHTDASSVGLAAVLMQNVNGTWKPIAYYSRSTSATEKHMHSYELETLAVVEGLESFKYYVCGKPIKVISDCNAVKTAMTKKELIPRIARWWLRIQDFDVEIEHRSEQQMAHVDALSRMPTEESREIEPATLRIDKAQVDMEDWLFTMQLQEKELQEIVEKIRKKDKEITKSFALHNGRLYRVDNNKKLWVVPKSLRYKITLDAHEESGHLSVERTIEKIQKLMWFPRMRNFVKSFMKSCMHCAFNKQPGGTKEGEYHFSNIEPIPFKTIHIDHLGPFPRSKKRNEHILVLVDSFTKYTIIRAVPTTATKFVLKVLDEVICFVGTPERIITDRGTAFTSKDFSKYCSSLSITHILNAVRTPRANGQVERMNRTIMSMLLPSAQNDREWDAELRTIQWSINEMTNSTTGCSPHEILFGFQPRDILGNKLVLILQDESSNLEPLEKRLVNLSELRESATKRIEEYRKKAKIRFDKSHSKPKQYKEGDLVLVGNEAASTGYSRKLEPRFKGPFLVSKVLDNDRYLIEDIPCSKRKQRHYCSVFASDGMKPWCSLPPFDDEDGSYSEDAE